jgi:hypothetical protein
MSRTKRSLAVIKNNWSYKSNRHADFKAAVNKDYDNDMLGFVPKVRPLLCAYEDKTPSAVSEVKYLSQCK